MGTTKVKVAELVFDWSLWPRHEAQEIDHTNLKRLKEVLESGFPLPPIVVNKKDNRIIDGFHRAKAYLSVFGDGAEIEAEMREYENDSQMFLDTISLNTKQGLPLSPQDKAHAYLKARKLHIPPAAIASAFFITTDKLKKFIEKRTATTRDGEKIALAAGARGLAGRILTAKEEQFARRSGGNVPPINARLLLSALEANLELTNQDCVLLTDLQKEITRVLRRSCHAI